MPLSLVNIPQKSEICILELGMNSYGEIKKLAEIAKPHIAIITNIGNAHIGNFSNALEIAREKSDIFRYFNKNVETTFCWIGSFVDGFIYSKYQLRISFHSFIKCY